MIRPPLTPTHQKGNVFALLFGAVALTGVLAAVGMQTLTGPVTTITRVTQKNIAETNLLMNAKIIANAVPLGANNGDPDSDNTKEAAAFVPAGGGETAPANGGFLPTDLGLALTDPWGSKYGYCVYDHGTATTLANYIDGDNTTPDQIGIQPLIAVISAGPDKNFQTACPTFSGGVMSIAKAAGSDDLVQEFTYEGASAAANGLWTLDSPGGQVAQLRDSANSGVQVSINRDTGIGDFVGVTTDTLAAKTDNVSVDGGLKVDVLGATPEDCDAANAGVLRFNTTTRKLVICDGVSEWKAAGSDLWLTDETNVWRVSGNVGIGTATPGSALDVVGAAEVSGNVTAGGDLSVGGAGAVTGNFVVNTDALSVDATNKFLGIGKATPTTALDVVGDTLLTGTAAVTDDFAVGTDIFAVDVSAEAVGIGTAAPDHQLDIIGTTTIGTVGSLDETQAIVRIQEDTSGPNMYLDGNTIVTDATMLVGSIGNAGMQLLANSSVAVSIDSTSAVSVTTSLGVGSTLGVNGATTLGSTLSVADDAAFDTDTLFVDASADMVGIGTNAPAAQLDVAGGIKLGLHQAGATCSPDGVIQYNGSQMQICIGGNWSGVSAIDKLDDIGDVIVPTPNDGEVLAWDDSANSGAGGWVNKNIIDLGPGNATAHGSDGDVQFNGGDELDSHPQFFFNKTDVRLGIGTSSPGTTLHVDGDATISDDVTMGADLVVDGTTLVVNSTLNSVGIGTAAPKAALEVTGGIKLGNDTDCAADKDGTIRFNGTTLELCLDEAWVPIQGSGGAGGPGSTMITGWPDAINCGPNNEPSIYYLSHAPAATGKYEYRNIWHAADRVVRFNSDKTFFDEELPATENGCTSKSITVLYAQARAYNFLAGAGGEGDNISFVPNAPDAIDCGDTTVNGTKRMLYMQTATTTAWTYAFAPGAAGIGLQVTFDPSDGSWVETINTAGWTNADACDGKTITQLTGEDRTYNLAGGGGADPDTDPANAVGSDGYVQFATSGTVDGEAGLQYNKATDRLSVGAGVKVGGDSTCAGGGADNGTIRFNTTVIQYCYNGTWVDMAASGTPVESDPQVGTVNNGGWCVGGAGGVIGCTTSAPVLTEVDPTIGTLTNGKWCSTDGSSVTCTQDAPTVTETDPEVGTLTNGKWCTTDGSVVTCTADAPVTSAGADKQVIFNDGGSALAGAVQLVWDKTTNRLGIGSSSNPTQTLDVSGKATAEAMILKGVAGNAPIGASGSAVREKLTAARTYYVRTDGSDSNDGLTNTSGGAFLTIQKAINVVRNSIDLGGYNVTIQVAPGTYAGAQLYGPFTGAGIVQVLGDATTPSNVVINSGTYGFSVLDNGILYVGGFRFTGAGNALRPWRGGKIYLNYNSDFAMTSVHMYASSGGYVECTANYSISGGSSWHWAADTGNATINCSNRTITLTGTPAFGAGFAYATMNSHIYAASNTYVGSATGSRYTVSLNGTIYFSTSTLPGSIAGTALSGGQAL